MRIELNNTDPDQLIHEVDGLVADIKPLLAGRHPGVQGAALAELVALWVAGHAPMIRDTIVRGHIEVIDKLVPLAERELFGPLGHPARSVS